MKVFKALSLLVLWTQVIALVTVAEPALAPSILNPTKVSPEVRVIVAAGGVKPALVSPDGNAVVPGEVALHPPITKTTAVTLAPAFQLADRFNGRRSLKYQTAMTGGRAMSLAPTFEKRATFTELNRFVFRQNPSDDSLSDFTP